MMRFAGVAEKARCWWRTFSWADDDEEDKDEEEEEEDVVVVYRGTWTWRTAVRREREKSREAMMIGTSMAEVCLSGTHYTTT